MIDKTRLEKNARLYGITLARDRLDALDRYAEILVEYNRKVNLTAITDREGIEEKHFLDSLILANCEYVTGSLADVGSGAGFPGVVALIYRPRLKLTVIDPSQKRRTFLKYLARKLGLKFDVVTLRGEEAGRKEYRDSFDTVTARAVAGMPRLCEYCLPLVKPGGHFIAMKGADDEADRGKRAMKKLCASHIQTLPFTLPTAGERKLVVCEKTAPTPAAYPRAGGKIKKSPLV